MRCQCRILHFQQLPNLNPPVCQRLLPLKFGQLLVWIKRLRLGRLPTSGHLENPVIYLRLHRADKVMSFPSAIFLRRHILLLHTIMAPRPSAFEANFASPALIYDRIPPAPSECYRLKNLHCPREWAHQFGRVSCMYTLEKHTLDFSSGENAQSNPPLAQFMTKTPKDKKWYPAPSGIQKLILYSRV